MLLFLSGCFISLKTEKNPDGGVYKSPDQGDTWSQISSIFRIGETTRSFGTSDITTMAMDPTDRLALYAGAEGGNLFYSYSGGEAWSQSLPKRAESTPWPLIPPIVALFTRPLIIACISRSIAAVIGIIN